MSVATLPAATHMGGVVLDVADLDAMAAFYRDALLLEQLTEKGPIVDLGRGAVPLVTLRHNPALPRGERRSAGLFHTALLHDSESALATTLLAFATRRPDLYTGSGDHLVSQAFYLDDPEGNGVELYVDRPREAWTWTNGRVEMDTLYIDPNAFLEQHLTEESRSLVETAADRRGVLPDATTVGHVHLKVGNTAAAKDFYVKTLGFDVTAEMPGALFVSAGGYHHHMAMNTWQTSGVGLRTPALGLGRVDIVLPDADALDAPKRRTASRGLPIRDTGERVEMDDPWGNLVRVTVA